MTTTLNVLKQDLSQQLQVHNINESEQGSLILEFDEQVTVNIYPFHQSIMMETQLIQLQQHNADNESILTKMLEIMLLKARNFPDNVLLEESALILQWSCAIEQYEKTYFAQRLKDHVHLSYVLIDNII